MTTSHAPVGHLTKGTLSPRRPVPAHIPRPEYVGRSEAEEGITGDFHDDAEIAHIREAGRIAADALEVLRTHIEPGVTTDALDAIAHEFMLDHQAYPSTLGYLGYPKSICTSLNEVICHGIPDSTVLAEGDILNIDITAFKNGVHGDTNYTFAVGEIDTESELLIERTFEATHRAIRAVKPGREINVIGRVIEQYAARFGYGVVRDFTGHGVGREFHSGLIVPHYDTSPENSRMMEPGMVFTIEPMLNLGTEEWNSWDDDWTIVTADRKRSAQFEHTLVVTDTGADILTLPSPGAGIASGPRPHTQEPTA